MLGSVTYTADIPANVPKWNLSIQSNQPLTRVHPFLYGRVSVLLNFRQDQLTTYPRPEL